MKKDNVKISSNKSFGIVFFIFFLIISIYPLFNDGNINIWLFLISIVFLTLGLLNSRILSPLNKIWFKFGILLGNIVSPIIMGVIFFLIVTPISIIMKLLGKNFLNLKKDEEKTYWIKKNEIKSKMDNQF
jgi:large-conductance mechanosensitive channel|tara:strand:+ start:93 stop:482 length:390 start_codon:yes stop_codon:yes gene_type:complete